jgi:hypothetical protein
LQLLGGLHHGLRAPSQAVDAPRPTALLAGLIFVEGRVDASERCLQRYAGIAPGFNQRPVQRREQ